MGRECLSSASQLDPVYSRQEGMRIGLIMDLVLPTQTPSPVTEVTNEGVQGQRTRVGGMAPLQNS
jgi:hypothetical protein